MVENPIYKKSNMVENPCGKKKNNIEKNPILCDIIFYILSNRSNLITSNTCFLLISQTKSKGKKSVSLIVGIKLK